MEMAAASLIASSKQWTMGYSGVSLSSSPVELLYCVSIIKYALGQREKDDDSLESLEVGNPIQILSSYHAEAHPGLTHPG